MPSPVPVPDASAALARHPEWLERTAWLLDSYRRWVGAELIARGSTPDDEARRLYEAPRVVVAHGTEADPILCYANAAALRLWEAELDALLAMPSRLTAEPVHRDERARLLQRTAEQGYVDDYQGIRISARGRRFRIHRATVWNVVDGEGRPAGQAATFTDWTPLGEE